VAPSATRFAGRGRRDFYSVDAGSFHPLLNQKRLDRDGVPFGRCSCVLIWKMFRGDQALAPVLNLVFLGFNFLKKGPWVGGPDVRLVCSFRLWPLRPHRPIGSFQFIFKFSHIGFTGVDRSNQHGVVSAAFPWEMSLLGQSGALQQSKWICLSLFFKISWSWAHRRREGKDPFAMRM